MSGIKHMAHQHDGWLGEPFASDFGAAWGIILLEDIYDGTVHLRIKEAAQAARAAGFRYVIYDPLDMHDRRGERKLYVRRGDTCLEIHSYLRHREQENDKAVLQYATDTQFKVRVKESNQRWRDNNRDSWLVANRERGKEFTKARRERMAVDPVYAAAERKRAAAYMRTYQPEYYRRNPDKLEAKLQADRTRLRKKRSKNVDQPAD